MFSVTQIIKNISQPYGGFVPKNLFIETTYDDINILEPIVYKDRSLFSIQGMAVDYLTRYMLFNNKHDAFQISILGAKIIDDFLNNNNETNHIFELLEEVKGLDDKSIYNACKVVGYDTAYRKGVKTYRDVEKISIPHEMIFNIRCMVNRGLVFLKAVSPVIDTNLTFEGGYTEVVSNGEGDYLTDDMIIDFKVSKNTFSNKWSLQLLMYYLLGIHSIHKEYKNVKYLCIYNPYLNKSYIAYLPAISNKAKYDVSKNVLGYKMSNSYFYFDDNYNIVYDYSTWNKIDGSNEYALIQIINDYIDNIKFDINKYKDGIHKITIEEYWSYIKQTIDKYKYRSRPKFKHTNYIIMIKKNGYTMFFSMSYNGTLNILSGAKLNKTNYSVEYYYDNIDRYVNVILKRFSKYWNALKEISNQIRSLEPSLKILKELYIKKKKECEKEGYSIKSFDKWYTEGDYKLSGRIHGCIVDIDWSNHIYLNPYDGTITPYHAISMYDKDVYKNIKSLIATYRPEMIEPLNLLKKTQPNALLFINNRLSKELIGKDNEIDKRFTKVYSYDMYSISNKLTELQKIYDKKLIQVWYDEILNENLKLLNSNSYVPKVKRKNKIVRKNIVGERSKQNGGYLATVIAYRNYEDIDIEFEDGHTIYNVSVERWRKGTILHPNCEQRIYQEKKLKKQQE